MNRRVERAADETDVFRVARRPLGCLALCRVHLDGGDELDSDEAEAAVVTKLHVARAVDLQAEQLDPLALGYREQGHGVTGSRCSDEEILGAPDRGDATLELRRRRDF